MEKYKLWLQKANDDLDWTYHNIKNKIWYGACFTSQQAAEKALKGFLIYNKKPLRKIHDIIALVEDCIKIDKSFKVAIKYAKKLLPYYIQTRYPIFEETQRLTEGQAKEAYDCAKEIIKFIEKKINKS